MSKRLVLCFGIMAFAIVASPTARADYSLEIISGAFDQVITDGGPLDMNAQAGQISVDVSTLNTLLDGANIGFNFSLLGGSSNALSPDTGTEADLLQNGTVFRNTMLGTGSITIIATENAFNFPIGPNILTSAAADTFLSFASSDNRTFQSRFTDADGSINSSTLVFPASASSNGTSPNVFLGNRMNFFTLTSTTVVNLSALNATDQFNGTTTVRAVPEPSSISLMILGGSALAVGYRRRNLR